MQDRQNTGDDSTLVDRGWAQMQAQLDEVMPVQKKRRFPWWIFIVIGAIGSLGAYQWVYSGVNQGAVQQPKQEQQVKPNQPTTPIAQLNIEAKQLASDHQNNHSNNGIKQLKKEKHLQQNTSIFNASEAENNTGNVEMRGLETNKIAIQPKNRTFNQTSNPIAEQHLPPTIKTEPILVDESINEKSIPKQLIADKIATIDYQPINSGVNTLASNIQSSKIRKSHLILRAGTEIGVNANPQAGSIGIAYQYKSNKAFTYEVGLTYQVASVNLISDAIRGIKDTDSRSLFAGGDITFAPDNFYALDQAYKYLQISKFNLDLAICKKIYNRWSLKAGVQASYYTNASLPVSQPLSIGLLENSAVVDQNLYDEEITVYNYDTASNRIEDSYDLRPARWQLSAQLGLRYRVSKRWEVEASYRKALTKWPDRRAVYGAGSFVGLGVGYYVW